MPTPNTNTPEAGPLVDLERENEEAIRQSVRQQWTVLSHLLHLPPFETLPTTRSRQVLGRIVDHIQNVRGLLRNRHAVEEALFEEFREARGESNGPIPLTAVGSLENAGMRIAEAWLKIIERHFTESDIRNIVSQLPPAIRRPDGSRVWQTGPVTIGAHTGPIRINLDDSIWRSGTEQQIRQRLLGRTPDQAGIDAVGGLTPPLAPLTPGDIDSIFNSRSDVIDPRLPLSQVRLSNITPNVHVVVDLPGLLREHAAFAGYHLVGWNLNLTVALYSGANGYFSCIDNAGNRVAHPPAAAVIDRLFQDLRRSPTASFGTRELTLSDAIAQRQPIDRLLSGSANAKELMLALGTIQRDPTTADTLQAVNADETRVRNEIQDNQRLATAVNVLTELNQAEVPELSQHQAILARTDVIHDMTQNIQNAKGAADGSVIALAAHYPVGNHRTAALQLGIPLQITRRRPGWIRGRSRIDNWPDLERLRDNIAGLQNRISEAERKAGNIIRLLGQLARMLRERGVTNADLNRVAPELCRVNPAPPPPYIYLIDIDQNPPVISDNDIDGRLNLRTLAWQARRAIQEGNQARPTILRDATHYESRERELATELDGILQRSRQAQPTTGSDACWTIIRRGLENQGLRGPELEQTIEYMRNQSQRSPQSARDVQTLGEAAFPYQDNRIVEGTEAHPHLEAEHEWNHGREIPSIRATTVGAEAGLMTGGIVGGLAAGPIGAIGGVALGGYLGSKVGSWFGRTDPWPMYRDQLFQQNAGIGMALHDNPRQRRFGMKQIRDAYFRTKYLMNLPQSDPLRIPKDHPEVVAFLRKLHGAYLERFEQMMTAVPEIRDQAIREAQAEGMNIDVASVPRLTMTERLQAAHDYLESDAYWKVNKGRNKELVDRISQSAYRTVTQATERSKLVLDAFSGKSSWNDNHIGRSLLLGAFALPGRTVRNVFAGQGSHFNPLTWPAKGAKSGWSAMREWPKVAAVSAVLGGLMMPPLGIAAGVAVPGIIKLWKKFSTPPPAPDATNGAPAAAAATAAQHAHA